MGKYYYVAEEGAKIYDKYEEGILKTTNRGVDSEKKNIFVNGYKGGYVQRHDMDAKSYTHMMEYLKDVERSQDYDGKISNDEILRLFIKANKTIREFVDNYKIVVI